MNYFTINTVLKNVRYYMDVRHGVVLPSEEFWDGNYALVNHIWSDWLELMLNGYIDTDILFWNNNINDFNYYISSYHRHYNLEERLWRDRTTWSFWIHRDASYFLNSNLRRVSEYTPDRWRYLNSWKEIPETGRSRRHLNLFIFKYPITPVYYTYDLPFLIEKNTVNPLKITYFDWLINDFPKLTNSWSDFISNSKKFWNLNKKFDITYSDLFKRDFYRIVHLEENARVLKHHDFAVGQYITCSTAWHNPLVHYNYPKVPGLYFYWYERFGSIEFFWQAIHANWHEHHSYIWARSWSVPTICDSYTFAEISDAFYIKNNFQWLRTISDGPKFLWNNADFMTKGHNTYVLYYLYADNNEELRNKVIKEGYKAITKYNF